MQEWPQRLRDAARSNSALSVLLDALNVLLKVSFLPENFNSRALIMLFERMRVLMQWQLKSVWKQLYGLWNLKDNLYYFLPRLIHY